MGFLVMLVSMHVRTSKLWDFVYLRTNVLESVHIFLLVRIYVFKYLYVQCVYSVNIYTFMYLVLGPGLWVLWGTYLG